MDEPGSRNLGHAAPLISTAWQQDVLVANVKGKVYAVSPKCPHLGLPMKTVCNSPSLGTRPARGHNPSRGGKDTGRVEDSCRPTPLQFHSADTHNAQGEITDGPEGPCITCK